MRRIYKCGACEFDAACTQVKVPMKPSCLTHRRKHGADSARAGDGTAQCANLDTAAVHVERNSSTEPGGCGVQGISAMHQKEASADDH